MTEPIRVNELRTNALVTAWIKTYQGAGTWRKHPDCFKCGWPHAENLLCGSGSTFGCVTLGGNSYYIDSSNVDYMVDFVSKLGPGFHWKNEVYFDVKGQKVVISRIEPYNNCPHVKRWEIPLNEWKSIVEEVQRMSEVQP